jgi:hypothetical protein
MAEPFSEFDETEPDDADSFGFDATESTYYVTEKWITHTADAPWVRESTSRYGGRSGAAQRLLSSLSVGRTTYYFSGLDSTIDMLGESYVPIHYYLSSEASTLGALDEELVRSRQVILALGEDWDGENSPGYNSETWDRAAQLARVVCRELVYSLGSGLIVPTIGPAMGGSIDVYWNTPDVTLLLNVPSDPSESVVFSGRRGGDTLNGILESARTFHLAVWLAGVK